MAKGKDYGYGQLEGSYIKPQKIDGKYYVRDQSFSLREIPKPTVTRVGVRYRDGAFSPRKPKPNKVKDKYTKGVKSPGRAQPKGTPPRTGPGSGAGGHSARYSRLTGGGLSKHGR